MQLDDLINTNCYGIYETCEYVGIVMNKLYFPVCLKITKLLLVRLHQIRNQFKPIESIC